MAPVVPGAAHREEALVPDDLGDDLEADPRRALPRPRRRGRRRARRSRPGGEGTRANASDQSTRVSPESVVLRWPCVRPRRAPVARVASSALGLAIDAHVRRLGRTQGVVHAVAPGRVEAARRRAGRSRGASAPRRRAGGRRPSGLVASPHRRRWSPSTQSSPGLTYGSSGGSGTSSGSVEPGLRRPRQVAEQRARSPASSTVTSARSSRELRVVAARHRADRVEGGEDERLLVGVEVDVQDRHGRLAAATAPARRGRGRRRRSRCAG